MPKAKSLKGRAVRDEAKRMEIDRLEREAVENLKTREVAQEQVRRELAAWVMAFRLRFEELLETVRDVYFASRTKDSLIHGQIDTKRLGTIVLAMQMIDGDVPMLVLKCDLPDVVALAERLQESLNV